MGEETHRDHSRRSKTGSNGPIGRHKPVWFISLVRDII